MIVQIHKSPVAQKFMDQALQPGGPAGLPPAFGKFMLALMFAMMALGLVTVADQARVLRLLDRLPEEASHRGAALRA